MIILKIKQMKKCIIFIFLFISFSSFSQDKFIDNIVDYVTTNSKVEYLVNAI